VYGDSPSRDVATLAQHTTASHIRPCAVRSASGSAGRLGQARLGHVWLAVGPSGWAASSPS